MKHHDTWRGALALALVLSAAPAFAGELADQSVTHDEILAIGALPDAHGPAGTMADHVHAGGEFMIGMMVMHENYGGANRSGTHTFSDEAIAAAGYTAKTKAMTMDMAMLHLMWAPSDRVTLMAVPSWMRMRMTMEGLPMTGTGADTGHGGHTMEPGMTMKHGVEGLGDTQFGALVALSRHPSLSAHAGLMVSAPTGKVDRRNADGKFVHYMMQGGSGTWDLIPSFTLRGRNGAFGWGAQASYLFRAEDANKSGFRFGDRFTTTAWTSLAVSRRASLSARLTYASEGRIKGHYNGAHSHAAPPDRQQNYGGRWLDAGVGANVVVGEKLRLGIEGAVPLYRDLNGIQSPRRYSLTASASIMM